MYSLASSSSLGPSPSSSFQDFVGTSVMTASMTKHSAQVQLGRSDKVCRADGVGLTGAKQLRRSGVWRRINQS